VSGDFGEQSRSPQPAAIRDATAADLPRLIELYIALGVESEDALIDGAPGPDQTRAFADVNADPRQRLLVIEAAGRVVGTLVLLTIPNVSRGGRPYGIVENVVVDAAARGRGYGETLMRAAIDEARRAGCYKIALTSRLRRTEAHRFYERLGFTAESSGFRLAL
jgi:GNAT superfamily N-acetyltransferase